MKRSPLTRRTPLKSQVPLRSKTSLLRKSELKRGESTLKKSKLKFQSKKRKELEGPEYSRLRLQFLKENPLCEGCLIDKGRGERVAINPSSEIQHKALRGKWLLRTDTWAAVCHGHGCRCTDDPTWAYETGMRMTREQIRLLEEQEL